MQRLMAILIAISAILATNSVAFAGGGTPSWVFPCTEDDGQSSYAYGGTMPDYTQWRSSHGTSYVEYWNGYYTLSFVVPANAQAWEQYSDGSRRYWSSGQQVVSYHVFIDCYLPVPKYPYYVGHMKPSSIDAAQWLLQQSNDVSMGNPEVQRLASQLRLRNPRVKLWVYNGELRSFHIPWGVEIITQYRTFRPGESTLDLNKALIRFTEVDYTP